MLLIGLWRKTLTGKDLYGEVVNPLKRGLLLSGFGLFGVFIPAATAIVSRIIISNTFWTFSGMKWVALGAILAIPTLCISYSYIAYRKDDKFAQRWFVAPLALIVALGLIGFIYYHVYIKGL